MKKLSLAIAAVASCALGSAAANAAVPITTQNLVITGSTGFYNGTVTCAADVTRCAFTTNLNFAAPAGFNVQSADITTTFTTPNQDIDFTSVLLNGAAFTLVSGEPTDRGSILNQPLLANNTLQVNGLAGTAAGGADAAFSGTLSFARTAPVPEPATWAMMLVGFGAVGFGMRRRQARSAPRLQAA